MKRHKMMKTEHSFTPASLTQHDGRETHYYMLRIKKPQIFPRKPHIHHRRVSGGQALYPTSATQQALVEPAAGALYVI